jgi:hypothetical protein
MKLNQNNKIKLRINCKPAAQLFRDLGGLHKHLVETNASLPENYQKGLTPEQIEYLNLLNRNFEELITLMKD